jgi:hypothetical protein
MRAKLLVCAFLALVAYRTALADVCTDRETALAGLDSAATIRALTPCLGRDQDDSSELTVEISKFTPDTTNSDVRIAGALHATEMLRSRIPANAASVANAMYWDALRTQLEQEATALRQARNGAAVSEVYAPEFWSALPQGQFGSSRKLDLWLPPCEDGTPRCAGYVERKTQVRIVKLGARLSAYLSAENLKTHAKDVSLRHERWEAYFHKALPQYWWEVWANGARMGNQCDKDSGSGIQTGFCDVPQNQLIFLHPEVGVEWTSKAENANELKPVVVIEAIGFNRWQWSAGGAELSGHRGASLVAAYGDRTGDPKWSYGVMFHVQTYSLAVTANGRGDLGLLLNIKMAGKYFSDRQKYRDYFTSAEKAPFLDVLLGR